MSKHIQRLTRLTNLYFGIVGAIGLALVAFLLYPAYADITDGLDRIASADTAISAHEADLTKERDVYRSLKENYLFTAANRRDVSRQILPTELEGTNVVRSIESHINALADSHNPVTLKSVTFGRSSEQKDVDYVTLPFKLTVNTTKEKLGEILRFFERSGTFLQPGEDAARRLLDVREVSIQAADPTALQTQSDIGSLDVDLSVNTYAQADGKVEASAETTAQ